MKKLLCLAALLGAIVAVGCGDSSDDAGTNAGANCQPVGTTLNCSKLEACCTNSSTCWYNAEKSGSSKKFDCAGSDCQSAAQQAVAFCQ